MPEPYFRTNGGLQFECTGCGDCCRKPGPVFFPLPELERAAAYLGLSPTAFRRKYEVEILDGVPAIDPPHGTPCPFLAKDESCTIYPVRPTQCSTFPFWPETVLRKRSWTKAAAGCEGINRGRRHSPAEIEQFLAVCEDAGLPRDEPW